MTKTLLVFTLKGTKNNNSVIALFVVEHTHPQNCSLSIKMESLYCSFIPSFRLELSPDKCQTIP